MGTKNWNLMKDAELKNHITSNKIELNKLQMTYQQIFDGAYTGLASQESIESLIKYHKDKIDTYTKECIRRNEWDIKRGKKPKINLE